MNIEPLWSRSTGRAIISATNQVLPESAFFVLYLEHKSTKRQASLGPLSLTLKDVKILVYDARMKGEKVGLYALVKLAAGASTTGSSTKMANVLIGVDMSLSNITTDIYTNLYLYQAISLSELIGLFGSGSISVLGT